MAGRMPSMVALLGLLAVAGYQNRGKISEMLQGANGSPGGAGAVPPQGTGILSELGSLFGGSAGGGTLSEGLGSLMDRFRGAGHAEVADSWVGTGTNRPLTPETLEQALDTQTMAELEQKTGLSRADILARLSKAIPDAVDRFTPDGRLPTDSEASRLV